MLIQRWKNEKSAGDADRTDGGFQKPSNIYFYFLDLYLYLAKLKQLIEEHER